jgi:predicted ATP-dependent endonuclease of OLD family
VSQALQLFLSSSRDKFTLHDFSASSWPVVEAFANNEDGAELPEISIDLWFSVEATDLHRVIDLLPSLSWQGSYVGIRITFSPIDADVTKSRFENAKASANAAIGEVDGEQSFIPFPKTLTDFLTTELKREYELCYYVLDYAKFNHDFKENVDYVPLEIIADKGATGKSRSGKDIINSLIRVDFLQAQRHLSDSSGGSRNEELSRHLSRFYKRNLEKRSDDYEAMRALSQSENLMNKHLEDVFSDTLDRLANLGYPGLTNPGLKIMSDLNPSVLMSGQDGAQVHYVLDGGLTLPDKYNGLGFKNLIYMVVELLDLHNQWVDISENRPPLHLVFIEEPEAHLHTQLQQVFVNKILDILIDDDTQNYSSQLILTTHSAHILYERGFKPIRYFRREHNGSLQSTTVLNLSKFYTITSEPIRDFLERYLKLTHCDLFFADAAILVEGNVERLLTPLMIEKVAPELKKSYLTILEIGGAYGYRFQSLIEFLGLTTLVITDLDSVRGLAPEDVVNVDQEGDDIETDEYEDIDEEDDGIPKKGSSCRVEELHAVTSNQTLIQWLPKENTISNLLAASSESKIQSRSPEIPATIKVCYQNTVTLTRGEENIQLAGRTLEEAFAFENLVWSQDISNKDLKLRVKSSDTSTLEITAERLHKRIHSKNFKKTDFALALLTKDINDWVVPAYMREGLEWLNKELATSPVASVVQSNISNNQVEVEE